MRHSALLALAAVVAVGVALTLRVTAGPASSRVALNTFGARGIPVPPSPGSRKLGVDKLLLLAKINGRAFYRATHADGRGCLGAGTADAVGDVGFLICGFKNFPSADVPVMAFPDVGAERAAPTDLRLFGLDGFAADGVARVVVTNRGGEVVGDTPVVDNVFSVAPSRGGGIGDVRAFDADGRLVFSQSYQ